MNSTFQNLILLKHNTLRSMFASGRQPTFAPAVKMNVLKWDPTLAYLAELNVRQCEMRHDACFKTDQFEYPGQNLYFTAQTRSYPDLFKAIDTGIQSWYDEYKFASQADLAKFTRTTTD